MHIALNFDKRILQKKLLRIDFKERKIEEETIVFRWKIPIKAMD